MRRRQGDTSTENIGLDKKSSHLDARDSSSSRGCSDRPCGRRVRGGARVLCVQSALQQCERRQQRERYENHAVVETEQLMSSYFVTLKRDPDESLADRRKRLKTHVQSTTVRWADLPPDVLRTIVKHVADEVKSSVPVVPVVASVCRSWRAIVKDGGSDLWRHANFGGDFDPTDTVILKYCTNGAFNELRAIDLRHCPKVTDKALVQVTKVAKQLHTLKVSDVGGGVKKQTKKPSRVITTASLLKVLSDSDKITSFEVDRVTNCSMTELTDLLKAAMTENAVALAVRGTPQFPNSITSLLSPSGMPHLTKLDLADTGGNLGGTNFPWLDMIRTCPSLKELKLNGFGGAQGWAPRPALRSSNDPWIHRDVTRDVKYALTLPGLDHLETLELGAACIATSSGYVIGHSCVNVELLWRLCWRSTKLKTLDVTGATGLRYDDLYEKITGLTRLMIVPEPWEDMGMPLEEFSKPEDIARARLFHPESLFCKYGQSCLETLRCARSGWATTHAIAEHRNSLSVSIVDHEDHVMNTLPRFRKLRHLELGAQAMHAEKVTDEAVVALTHMYHGRSLEHLSIAGAAVTDDGVSFLTELCPSLKTLDLSGCRGLSRETRKAANEGGINEVREKSCKHFFGGNEEQRQAERKEYGEQMKVNLRKKMWLLRSSQGRIE